MDREVELEIKIEKLKQQLIYTAEENNFDFQHPHVLHLSEEIDFLIVKKMKYGNTIASTV